MPTAKNVFRDIPIIKDDKPLVSIVTVCLNRVKSIRETISSVLEQNYNNIEYIVIDGGSIDGTLNVIKEYESKFRNRIKWISEQDKGIYDAMNKGIDRSHGEYLLFLNAGDYFLDSNIIKDMVDFIVKNDVDLLFGDIEINLNENKYVVINNHHSKFDLIFRTICHQAVLADRKCFKNNKFDENYKWAADYKWLIKCFEKNNIKYEHIDRKIASFDRSDITFCDSYTLKMQRLEERLRVGNEVFRGIEKIVFLINHLRILIKSKYF